MAKILIGNIRGPQGIQGKQGIQGIQGIPGIQGPMPPLIASYLATAAGQGALDAYMGKLIDQRLTDLMNKFTQLNGDLGVIKFVRGDAPHVPGDENRNQAIKNFVDSLPNNSGIYIASFIFGSAYTLIIQKYSDISFASVFVFGYSVGQPIFFRKIVGEWV